LKPGRYFQKLNPHLEVHNLGHQLCPKLDETESYAGKLAEIIRQGNAKTVTVVHMEVPCCYGLRQIAEEAVRLSGKNIPVHTHVITVAGEKL